MAELFGHLDAAGHALIEGWAFEPDAGPVRLRVRDGQTLLGEVLADAPRAGLATAGYGNGHHAFRFVVPGGLDPAQPHEIWVERAADGCVLPGAPRIIPAEAAPPLAVAAMPARWRGHLDRATRERVMGWAWDPQQPDQPVALQIVANGRLLARVLANRFRDGLQEAGIGSGYHGFDVRLPGGLSPLERQVIQVIGEADGGEIENSPSVIEPATAFGDDLRAVIERAVTALDAPETQGEAALFLAGQAARLLRQRADAQAGREAREARRAFIRRFGPALDDQGTACAPRALVVDDHWPDPGAASAPIVSHMRALQSLGYTVVFAPADLVSPAADPSAMLESIEVVGAPYAASIEEVLRLQADCFDLVYLHRISNAGRYMALARHFCPKARIVYSVAHLHHRRLERQARAEARPELAGASARVRLAECVAAAQADLVITHTPAEADVLARAVPGVDVHVVGWDHPVQPVRTPWAARSGIGFIGDYADGAVMDAAQFLTDEIMPIVHRTNPGLTCFLAGRAAPAPVRALARPGLVVLDDNADMAALLERIRLTVAPLRYGAGISREVLASLAAGLPCVATGVAAEGLAVPPACIADTPEAIAASILRLHETEDSALIRAGLEHVAQDFTQHAVTDAMKRALAIGT